MLNTTSITFILFLLGFIFIGAMSVIKSKKTSSDYLIASQNIKPWLVALSAVATNNSGYMFIGQIGFTYVYGLSSIWLMVGWILGDFTVSSFVHKKLRIQSETQNFESFGGALSRWNGRDYKKLRLLVGIITIVFLGVYAAAQFKAGGKALHVLFGWDYSFGAIIGAIIVLIYCFAGGIRASIWTDAAQSMVMIFAMGLLLYCGISSLGGYESTVGSLNNISDTYLSLWPSQVEGGIIMVAIWIVGWFFGGAAIIGMPHVMIRFMALDDPDKIQRTRFYYYLWYILFYAFSIGVGLISRAILPEVKNFDPELALPLLSIELLSPYLVGLILAGLFSATMSTADSLILSCSASITRDLLPKEKSTLLLNKIATLFVTILSLIIAISGGTNVFNLVLIAVSVLASAFAPLLILYVLKQKVSEPVAIIMMITGVVTAIAWKDFGLSAITYEIAPGMISGFLVYFGLKNSKWNR